MLEMCSLPASPGPGLEGAQGLEGAPEREAEWRQQHHQPGAPVAPRSSERSRSAGTAALALGAAKSGWPCSCPGLGAP